MIDLIDNRSSSRDKSRRIGRAALTALNQEMETTMLIGIIIGLVIGFIIGAKAPSIRLFISYLRKGGMG